MSRKVSGFRAWMIQRLSAIYLGAYIIYLFIHFIIAPPVDHAAFRMWLADPVISLSGALFFVALLLHIWIGVRDIVMDYVHPVAARITVLSAIAVVLLICGLWVARILILVAI